MFFDSLGHGFKDFVIIMFIIFTLILSIYIMSLNSKVHWWQKNCVDTEPSNDRDKNKPDDFAVVLASIFMGTIILVVLYAIYEFYTKGRIVGISNMGKIRM